MGNWALVARLLFLRHLCICKAHSLALTHQRKARFCRQALSRAFLPQSRHSPAAMLLKLLQMNILFCGLLIVWASSLGW